MKFNFVKKLKDFRDNSLSSEVIANKTRKKLIFKIIIAAIVVCAIVNVILLGLVNSKVKALYLDKKNMAQSLSKIFEALPEKTVPQPDFMDCNLLPGYTDIISRQIKDISSQKNIMINSLQEIANSVQYENFNISGAPDMNVVQSKVRGLSGYTKKLFDFNEKLVIFVINMASLTEQKIEKENEFKNKLRTFPEDICLPILEDIEKGKKEIENLRQEIDAKTNTIAELRKTIEGVSTNKNKLNHIIQQQQNELIKAKNEYSGLKAQIEKATTHVTVGKSLAITDEKPVKKTSYPELYHKLKGNVVEYNPKWGFIIINFGNDSKLNIEGEEVNVPVPLDTEVYIARGSKFVAKAKIVSVYSKYSVANIIFPVAEEIQKGDNVFFDQPKNN